jgi:hypothetical protein
VLGAAQLCVSLLPYWNSDDKFKKPESEEQQTARTAQLCWVLQYCKSAYCHIGTAHCFCAKSGDQLLICVGCSAGVHQLLAAIVEQRCALSSICERTTTANTDSETRLPVLGAAQVCVSLLP